MRPSEHLRDLLDQRRPPPAQRRDPAADTSVLSLRPGATDRELAALADSSSRGWQLAVERLAQLRPDGDLLARLCDDPPPGALRVLLRSLQVARAGLTAVGNQATLRNDLPLPRPLQHAVLRELVTGDHPTQIASGLRTVTRLSAFELRSSIPLFEPEVAACYADRLLLHATHHSTCGLPSPPDRGGHDAVLQRLLGRVPAHAFGLAAPDPLHRADLPPWVVAALLRRPDLPTPARVLLVERFLRHPLAHRHPGSPAHAAAVDLLVYVVALHPTGVDDRVHRIAAAPVRRLTPAELEHVTGVLTTCRVHQQLLDELRVCPPSAVEEHDLRGHLGHPDAVGVLLRRDEYPLSTKLDLLDLLPRRGRSSFCGVLHPHLARPVALAPAQAARLAVHLADPGCTALADLDRADAHALVVDLVTTLVAHMPVPAVSHPPQRHPALALLDAADAPAELLLDCVADLSDVLALCRSYPPAAQALRRRGAALDELATTTALSLADDWSGSVTDLLDAASAVTTTPAGASRPPRAEPAA